VLSRKCLVSVERAGLQNGMEDQVQMLQTLVETVRLSLWKEGGEGGGERKAWTVLGAQRAEHRQAGAVLGSS
jgi:hypothetical protein